MLCWDFASQCNWTGLNRAQQQDIRYRLVPAAWAKQPTIKRPMPCGWYLFGRFGRVECSLQNHVEVQPKSSDRSTTTCKPTFSSALADFAEKIWDVNEALIQSWRFWKMDRIGYRQHATGGVVLLFFALGICNRFGIDLGIRTGS